VAHGTLNGEFIGRSVVWGATFRWAPDATRSGFVVSGWREEIRT